MNDLASFLAGIDGYLTADRIVLIYYVFNCAVQSLPDPNGGKFYQFIYRFCHLLAGNTNLVRRQLKDATFHEMQRYPTTTPKLD